MLCEERRCGGLRKVAWERRLVSTFEMVGGGSMHQGLADFGAGVC